MTRAELNEIITSESVKHGFETREDLFGIETPKSEELNFTVSARHTDATNWKVGRIVKKVTFTASVRRMGGEPSVEELLKTADEIKRGAELVSALQSLDLTYTEQHCGGQKNVERRHNRNSA